MAMVLVIEAVLEIELMMAMVMVMALSDAYEGDDCTG